MRSLILLILKRSSMLLFLIMELLCAVLVINYNSNQGEIFLTSSNFFAGKLYNNVNSVKGYFNLNEVADSLATENEMLRNQLASSRYINIPYQDTLRKVQVDSLGQDSVLVQFYYTNAKVINNSVASSNNYLTLDRGAQHGVQKSMGVVSAHGIVGIVAAVSTHFATVKSILSKDLKISGNIYVDGIPFSGSLTWQSHDHRFLNMDYVPKYAKIAQGDSVLTSGFSTVFPEGYSIGQVDTFFVPPGSAYYKIRVQLSEDMTTIRRVYVANNLLKEEQKKLEATNE